MDLGSRGGRRNKGKLTQFKQQPEIMLEIMVAASGMTKADVGRRTAQWQMLGIPNISVVSFHISMINAAANTMPACLGYSRPFDVWVTSHFGPLHNCHTTWLAGYPLTTVNSH